MAAFFGTVRGNRGEATRCGTADSGISASVQSYRGSVSMWLRYLDDKPTVDVYINDGSSRCGRWAFTGTIDELRDRLAGDEG